MTSTATTRIRSSGTSAPSSNVEAIKRLDQWATLMDSQFMIPGTNIKFGLDSVVGLVPGIGDTLGVIASAYIIQEAKRLGISKSLEYRMWGNVVIDAVVGAIPLVGDLFDLGFKANRRNVDLLRRHVADTDVVIDVPARS